MLNFLLKFLSNLTQLRGEGTLLDHSIIALGSGLGDGKYHTMDELPIIVAGSAMVKLRQVA